MNVYSLQTFIFYVSIVEDKAKGRDSIACRDIRYSAKECAVSRYVERPGDGSVSQKSTPVATEKPGPDVCPRHADNSRPEDNQRPEFSPRPVDNRKPEDNQRPGANQRHEVCPGPVDNQRPEDNHRPGDNQRPRDYQRPEDIQLAVDNRRPEDNQRPADEHLDTASCVESLLELAKGEQLLKVAKEMVASESPAQVVDASIWLVGSNLAAESEHRVATPDQPDNKPEQQLLMFREPPVLPSSFGYSAFSSDQQNLLYPAQSYAPVFMSSGNLASTLDKPSILKADAAPFVSRSQTNFGSPAIPVQ